MLLARFPHSEVSSVPKVAPLSRRIRETPRRRRINLDT